MSAVTGISGIQLSAASAAYAPTNSADVSAIASAYQVVSATATQLNAGTAYVTSINETPISAARAGNAANASLANSAWYDGTGRLISALPDEATVSSIASSYAESAASSKLDESATADFYSTSNPSGFITGVDLSDYATTAYVDSSVSSKLDTTAFNSGDFYSTSNPSGFITGVDLSDYATTAYVDSSVSSFVDSAYVDSQVSGKEDKLTFGYDDSAISSINGSALAGVGGAQVVTSLQYVTSESATVASTVTADTAVGYGARYISADYYDYGYGPWTDYDSSKPLIQVRMTAVGDMTNYSSYPYYLYVVPYGATDNGNVGNTRYLTGALAYGEFSGGMNDFIVAEGTGSASQDPYCVEVTFDVTHVPFVGSEPAFWGTVEEHYAVVDIDEGTKPVFCVAGGYDGSNLFELRNNTTAELDFGSIVTVSAVSGINELEIAGAGGGIDSATVSAIASSYAEDVSAAASGAVSTVASNSADWMKLSKCFSGIDGIVTAVGSSTILTASASSFMGIGSAIKSTTGSGAGFFPDIKYAMGLSGYYQSIKLSADDWQTYVQCMDGGGSIGTFHLSPTAIVSGVSGDISAYSTNGAFTLDYTANSVEPLAFQSDLTGAGVDSATVSAIASAYAESAASSKLDTTAFNSGDFYTTANESGYVDSAYVDSAVSGKADASALSGYYTTANESGFITGVDLTDYATTSYVDSAVSSKADNSALSSYALSADVSGTVDLVSTQSANWGGSALALSAGPGVKLEKVGDTLVASTDETVLWSGVSSISAAPTIPLSEACTNFYYMAIYGCSYPTWSEIEIAKLLPNGKTSTHEASVCISNLGNAGDAVRFNQCQLNWSTPTELKVSSPKQFSLTTGATATAVSPTTITRIVGINRTAEV